MKIIATDVASGEVVEKAIEFDMVASRSAFGKRADRTDVFNPDR
ncbi:MAG: hypothetical protein ACFHWZ_02480 [Phycisphaerales bacterium]